jgi:hypothetical protein
MGEVTDCSAVSNVWDEVMGTTVRLGFEASKAKENGKTSPYWFLKKNCDW